MSVPSSAVSRDLRFGPLPESAARPLFLINALVPTIGIGLSLILTIFDVYPSDNTDKTLLGYAGQGLIGRLLDFATYFTNWSSILVLIVMWLLFANPRRDGAVFRVLRLDSLLMIAVTGIIYQYLLAASAHLQGWEYVTNMCQHILTPIITIVVWLLVGPRRQIGWVAIPLALILPIGWAVYALLRGAVIGAYPYGFLNVTVHGLGGVIITVIEIAIFGVILSAILLGLDRLLSLKRK